MDANDLLLTLYKENAEHARLHETLRERATAVCGAIAAALLGFAAHDGLTAADRPIGIALVVTGLLGALLSAKHYERFRRHSRIAGAFRTALETKLTQSTSKMYDDAVDAHNARFPIMHRVRLYIAWVLVNLFVVAVGAWIAWCTTAQLC